MARLLLIRLSAMGDVIHCLPALARLREARPADRIDFATQSEFAPLLEGHPQLDAVVGIPIRRLRGFLGRPWSWPRLAGELAALRGRLAGYDAVLDFQGNLKSALVARLTGSPVRIGPAAGEAREGSALLMTARPPAPPDPRRHRADRALALLAPLGIPPEWRPPVLPAYPRAWAEACLATHPGPGPVVLLHPGTSPKAAFKRWPTGHFAALGRALAADFGARVLVLAGPGEEGLAAEVAGGGGAGVRGLPPAPGLRELAGLIAAADLFVGADSGPAHLADALGVPNVVLFGPKDPGLYGPRRRGTAVRLALDCSPCGLRRCRFPRVHCMEDLGPAAVARISASVLERKRPEGLAWEGPVRVLTERS